MYYLTQNKQFLYVTVLKMTINSCMQLNKFKFINVS